MGCRIEWQFRWKGCCSAGVAVLPSICQAVRQLEPDPGWRHRNPGHLGLPTNCVPLGVRQRNVPARRAPPTPAPLKNAPASLPTVPCRRVSGHSLRDIGYARSTGAQHRPHDASRHHCLVVSVKHVLRELGSTDRRVHDDLQHGGEYDLCSDWGALFMPVSPCTNSCPKLGNQD